LSFWSELKRRNVFRVGIAYLAGIWLLLQVASVVLPSFDAPQWAMRAIILASALGFPVAVVLAWLYEWTPEGIKPESRIEAGEASRVSDRRVDFVIIGILSAAILFLGFDEFVIDESSELSELESVAVLPFENLTTNPEDAYIADGLSDEVLSTLSRIHELRVASRLASQFFKGKNSEFATIAQTLQVSHILSGGLRRNGNRVRVTVALDSISSGQLVWSETFDRDVSDILSIQNDIARAVARAIVPSLSAQSERRLDSMPTENTEAYDLYLRGLEYLREPAEESTVTSAIQLFENAIGRDGKFAQAHAGLCESHLADFYLRERAESFEKAERACRQALILDDGLWAVHVALGNLYIYSGKSDDAVVELEAAIADQPSAVTSYLALAQAYVAQNRTSEAEATFLKAGQVESGYWGVHNELGNFYWHIYRYDEAIPHYERVIELAPDSGIGQDNLGVAYQALGEFEESIRIFDSSPLPSRWTYANRGLSYYYLHEFHKSVEDLLKAVELAPDVHSSWGRLGDSYRYIPGEEESAESAYGEAIRHAEEQISINSSDWESVARLSTYYANTQQFEHAEEALESLIELTTDPTAYYFAALTSLKLGKLKDTYEYLEEVLRSGWSRPTVVADPDFAAILTSPEFTALLEQYPESNQ